MAAGWQQCVGNMCLLTSLPYLSTQLVNLLQRRIGAQLLAVPAPLNPVPGARQQHGKSPVTSCWKGRLQCALLAQLCWHTEHAAREAGSAQAGASSLKQRAAHNG